MLQVNEQAKIDGELLLVGEFLPLEVAAIKAYPRSARQRPG